MNSTLRIILEAVSIFLTCILLAWMLTLTDNATEANNTSLNSSDLTTYNVTKDNDFVDYLPTTECIATDCACRDTCDIITHAKVKYYRKEIQGAEVLRLLSKYNEIIEGTILVRTDKITRNYNKDYKFIKSMPSNLDFISPTETFIAKVILHEDKPYTMYFTQKGTMFYTRLNEGEEKEIEELMFFSAGHNASNFLMFTETGDYNFPQDTRISKIKLYACASGKGTRAGEALAGESVEASAYGLQNFRKCSLEVTIIYEGITAITLRGPGGAVLKHISLDAGMYDNSMSGSDVEKARNIFGAYTTGDDGEDGSDGYTYTVKQEYGKTSVIAETLTYRGGKGGEGGLYGFGGAGGNAGYVVNYESGIATFESYPAVGGSGGVIGYTGGTADLSTKLLTPVIVGYGGHVEKSGQHYKILNNTVGSTAYLNTNSIRIGTRSDGGSGTLYYGGHGGTTTTLAFSGRDAHLYAGNSWIMFNGAGGGGGGYGAGGGEAGECQLNTLRNTEHGKPSGGMVYLEFYGNGGD